MPLRFTSILNESYCLSLAIEGLRFKLPVFHVTGLDVQVIAGKKITKIQKNHDTHEMFSLNFLKKI